MTYNLIITERAEELLDQCVSYILDQFKNKPAAKHLLDGIDALYERLEENPLQFSDCRDSFLKSKGYKEAIVTDMDYMIIFRIENDTIYVLGIFHQLEKYREKL